MEATTTIMIQDASEVLSKVSLDTGESLFTEVSGTVVSNSGSVVSSGTVEGVSAGSVGCVCGGCVVGVSSGSVCGGNVSSIFNLGRTFCSVLLQLKQWKMQMLSLRILI